MYGGRTGEREQKRCAHLWANKRGSQLKDKRRKGAQRTPGYCELKNITTTPLLLSAGEDPGKERGKCPVNVLASPHAYYKLAARCYSRYDEEKITMIKAL